jgi:tRNA-modifying protein YgfZ
VSDGATAAAPLAAAAARVLVWVEGPDSPGFLQGLLSQDVAGLAIGTGRPSLLLDAKGHIVADLIVHRDAAEAFTLVAEPHLGDVLAATLERYHFSEDLEILGPEAADALVAEVAARPEAPGADLVVPGPLPGTWTLIVPDPAAAAAALGMTLDPPDRLERARVAAGVPRVGIDTGERTLVQEAGLQDVAVSFDKGCYLGQETVARVEYRGKVNRRLVVLRLGEDPPAPPARVNHGGREVGTLTSVAPARDGEPALGLAILRTAAGAGDAVTVGSGTTGLVMSEARGTLRTHVRTAGPTVRNRPVKE